jgi:short-subunit dehydrogenase
MNKCIAILGAGTGLGASLAREYGRKGYAIALVARSLTYPQQLAQELASQGITVEVFSVDLRNASAVKYAIAAIQERFGFIETLYYGPNAAEAFKPAYGLTVDDVKEKVELFLYGLVAAVEAVLPAMRTAKTGNILVALGGSAAIGLPFMSGPGPALAAARNYLYSLHGELASQGIYVGMLTLSAMIKNSHWHRALASGAIEIQLPPGFEIPEVEPAFLAQTLIKLTEERNTAELVYP